MRRRRRLWAVPLLLQFGAAVGASCAPRQALIFHKQNGYVHAATDTCVALLKERLALEGVPAEATTDSLAFTPANLARFGVVVFYNTNYRGGPLLDRRQEAALEKFIQGGGGFAGIHSAVPLDGGFEESIWPWYARLFGARFKGHPPARFAPMLIEDATHPSTRGLPGRIVLYDEWYALQANPRSEPGVRVLATVDETGFPQGSGMGDHPVSWHREFEGGRSFATLVGHDLASFSHPDFLRHLAGGIGWAGGWEGNTTIRGEAAGSGAPEPRRSRSQVFRGRDGRRLEVFAVDGSLIEARLISP